MEDLFNNARTGSYMVVCLVEEMTIGERLHWLVWKKTCRIMYGALNGGTQAFVELRVDGDILSVVFHPFYLLRSEDCRNNPKPGMVINKK